MKQEVLDSTATYSIAGAGIIASMAQQAQALTLIGAFILVVIRLIYDVVRLYRYLKSKD